MVSAETWRVIGTAPPGMPDVHRPMQRCNNEMGAVGVVRSTRVLHAPALTVPLRSSPFQTATITRRSNCIHTAGYLADKTAACVQKSARVNMNRSTT